jgi:Uma2 family endonuclease
MSGLPQSKEYRYTIEEFEEMDFGDLAAELIDGLVVVAEAFPSDQHGLITANLAYHLRLALDASGNQQCRPMSTSGVRIRGSDHGLPNDNALRPDLAVRCLNEDGTWSPSVIVEVLSKSNAANDMVDKLRAYKAVPAIQDILYLNQDEHYAMHHQRYDGEWQVGVDLSGPDAEILIERWKARIRLEDVYEKVFS